MIRARVKAENPQAAIGPYDEMRKGFSWTQAQNMLLPEGSDRVNIVEKAVDRWATGSEYKDTPALIYEGGGKTDVYTFKEIAEISCRWANLLTNHGFRAGERLFIFHPPSAQTYFAMVACARIGVVFCNLFFTSTYDELAVRIQSAKPSGILTHPDLVERLPVESMGGVRKTFLTSGPPPGLFASEVLTEQEVEKCPPVFRNRLLPSRAPLYLNYTSGATGMPKGIIHTHHDMVGMHATGRMVLGLSPGSVIWTEADPAWVTGTVYGAFAPWLCGATTLVQGDPLTASNLYRTLERHRVEVWYTTPTTIRRLTEAGEDLPGRYDFSRLCHIATVGEPLVPDLFYWTRKNLGHSPHDTWWMTETGIICLANFPTMDIKPGSMGKPVPGIEAAVVDEEGERLPPMAMGELALRVGWPGLMSGLWGEEERYFQYFRLQGWFLTGDMALEDDDGYFYHQGRNDDLIKVAGVRMIGPYEIEHALYMHPAVGETAVISKGGEPGSGRSAIKAFITLNPGFSPSTRLKQEIRAFLRANLSPEIVVREIEFLDTIPKTRSGKVLRRVLRARELGLPGGQTLNLKD